MTRDTNPLNRRTALKKGGVLISALSVGLPAISGTAAADDIDSMFVDVPPSISPTPRGNVTVVILPDGDKGPKDISDEMGNGAGLKLGPHKGGDDNQPTTDELEKHADAVRWRLINHGVHGEALGVFFDATTADEWFTPEHSQAKVSAVQGDVEDIIAWGWRSVTIPSTS